jgi:galactose oxidase
VKQVNGASDDLSFALALEVDRQQAPVPGALTVMSPNGGEVLSPGGVTPITWSTGSSVSTVDLEYSTDAGASWLPIASQVTASTGTYSWTLPNVNTTRALVRVTQTGGGASDMSDAQFTISSVVSTRVIAFGATWKYQDTGIDPGPTWNTASFDDTGWKSGAGQLGYGDGDEATLLTRLTPSQPSVYFRKKIVLNGPVTSATLRVLFDDGVVVYVNGHQVFTRNVVKFEHARYAAEKGENTLEMAELPLTPNPFVAGENTIAAMVKQVGATSPDLSFDLSLDVGIEAPTQ